MRLGIRFDSCTLIRVGLSGDDVLSVDNVVKVADSSDYLHIAQHDGDSLRVVGHDVTVLKEVDDVRLGDLLQRGNGVCLPAEPRGVPRGEHLIEDLFYKSHERLLLNEHIGGSLVVADLA